MPSFSQTFVNVVQVEIDKMWKKELILDTNFMGALFSQSETRAKAYTHDFIGQMRWDIFTTQLENATSVANQHLLAETPFTVTGGANATREDGDNNLTRRTPPYNLPAFRRTISTFTAGDINVPVPRSMAKVVGKAVAEVAREFMPLIKNGASVLKMQLLYDGLFKPMLEQPRFDQSGTRTISSFPVDQNYLAPLTRVGTTDNYRANLTISAMQDLKVKMLNDCKKSYTSNTGPLAGSLSDVGGVWITSNMGWHNFIKTNAAVMGNRDTFGKDITFKDYGTFKTFLDMPVITIPDDSGGGTGETGKADRVVGLGTAYGATKQTDHIEFPVTVPGNVITIAADTATVGALVPGSEYPDSGGGDARTGKRANTEGLFQMTCVYPKAMDFRTVAQYDIPPEMYRHPDRSMEHFIYSCMGLDTLKMYKQGVYRIWFSGPDKTVKFNP